MLLPNCRGLIGFLRTESRHGFTYDSYVKARFGWHGLTSDEFTEEGPFLTAGTDVLDGEIHWGECEHCTQERYDQDPYMQF
jgi:type I restriction enzyme S subunit